VVCSPGGSHWEQALATRVDLCSVGCGSDTRLRKLTGGKDDELRIQLACMGESRPSKRPALTGRAPQPPTHLRCPSDAPDGGQWGRQVAALEQENVSLRHTLQQRTQQMKGMQGRVAALELEANEATEKARHAVEEQSKLVRHPCDARRSTLVGKPLACTAAAILSRLRLFGLTVLSVGLTNPTDALPLVSYFAVGREERTDRNGEEAES
jgi:hypothetical protein